MATTRCRVGHHAVDRTGRNIVASHLRISPEVVFGQSGDSYQVLQKASHR